MKTFYGVMAELFNGRYSGTNQAVICRVCKEKPKNRYTEKQGMTAFNIWFDNEADAAEVCEMVRTGDIGEYTLLSLFKTGLAA